MSDNKHLLKRCKIGVLRGQAGNSCLPRRQAGLSPKENTGAVLISTFMILVTLTAMTVGFLWMLSVQSHSSASDIVSSKALWLAEAGIQKAIWKLKTPTGSGGQGENWTTTGTTENLGDGSYTMVVSRYDFALASNGASASTSSATAGHAASDAIDGSDATYWESTRQPSVGNPEELTVTFPYPLTINKVRFLVPTGVEHTPKKYTWEVSTNGTSYTVVVDANNNFSRDVTDTFSAQSNVSYLKLKVTSVGIIVPPGGPPGTPNVAIATAEAIGSKITSTGTVASFNRKLEQTVIADDGSPQSQVAYDQIDWTEIVPA